MTPSISRVACYLSAAGLLLALGLPTTREARPALPPPAFRAVMLSPELATPQRIAQVKAAGSQAVVLELRGGADLIANENQAARRVLQSQLDLYYWVEVARCPELADGHPLWMSSLQGHQQWRRFFPSAPTPAENEVVKNYPWVPILYQETFEAQLDRVRRLLKDRPAAKGIFLNDLQAGPSACGCGNPLCRWTADYGKFRTATPLGNNAAARFVAAVAHAAPKAEVIPVWTTECEAHDAAADGLCAGVACFTGRCWPEYTAQLEPVARQNKRLAVLVPFRAFARDLPIYGENAAWIRHAIQSFQTMPQQHQREPVAASRLIAVLQGWDVSDADLAAQMESARQSGAAGYIVSHVKIDQSWQPRNVRFR